MQYVQLAYSNSILTGMLFVTVTTSVNISAKSNQTDVKKYCARLVLTLKLRGH